MDTRTFTLQFLDGATDFATGALRKNAGHSVKCVADQFLMYAKRHADYAPDCLLDGRRSVRNEVAQELLMDALA